MKVRPSVDVLRALQTAFSDTVVLHLMKTKLKLLPFVFQRSRLEEFMHHPSQRIYTEEALSAKRFDKKPGLRRVFKNGVIEEALV